MVNFVLFCLLMSFSEIVYADTTTQGYPIVRADQGEACTICGTSLDSNDVVLIVRGRRVPLDAAMVDEFLANEEVYFARLQPRGALFQEEERSRSTGPGGVDLFWFLVGFYVLTAVIFSGLSAYVAVSKGLKPFPHFLIGLGLSALGFLYVLTRPRAATVASGLGKVHATNDPVACEKCAYPNHPSARRCSRCATTLRPSTTSEVERIHS
jgi:hypothetical protein